MTYMHTQKAPLHYVLYGAGIILAVASWLGRNDTPILVPMAVAAVVMLLVAPMFGYLTVRDDGEQLVVEYGPLPLFRKRIPYAEMAAAAPARSSFIDGWGIHWGPGEGWIYNLWGFDCVKIALARTAIRIGTDDPANLTAFLRGKIEASKK